MNIDDIDYAEVQKRIDLALRPWVLSGESVYQWIVRQENLWDIKSKDALAESITVEDAVFRNKCSAACGIYFLMSNDGGIYYIGKATSIRQRIINHWQRGKNFERCYWVEMPLEAAEIVEAYYIRRYRFSMNIKMPSCADSLRAERLGDAIQERLKYHNDDKKEGGKNAKRRRGNQK